jgi:chorismate mutase
MSPPLNHGAQELRDDAGSTVGFFLPDRQLRELLAERDALMKQVAELQAQLAAERAEAAQIRKERDAYLETAHYLTRKDLVPFTAEELADIRENGIPFEEVIAEVERAVQGQGHGG